MTAGASGRPRDNHESLLSADQGKRLRPRSTSLLPAVRPNARLAVDRLLCNRDTVDQNIIMLARPRKAIRTSQAGE